MKDTPPASSNLPALVVAAAAAVCGWVVADWWGRSSFPAPMSAAPGKSQVRLHQASRPSGTADLLRRLADLKIPDGATMDLRSILALRATASRNPALDVAVEECLLAELIKHDPQGALKAALRGAPGHMPEQLVSRVMHLWLQQDFDGAVAAVNELPPSQIVEQRWTLAKAVARANPRKAVEMAENGELPWLDRHYGRRELFKEALPRLAGSEGGRVMEWACGTVPVESRIGSNLSEYGEVVQPALREWLKHDPGAARQWIAEHLDDNQGALGIAAAAALLQTDAKEGLRLMEEAIARRKELKQGDWEASGGWRQIAEVIAKANPDAALARARELPVDDPLRGSLLETACMGVGEKLPAKEKLALLTEAMEAGNASYREHAHWRISHEIVGTMQTLAAEDPAAALRQAKEFPDAALATAAVLSHVMQHRPESAPALLRDALSEPASAAAITKVLSSDRTAISSGSPMDYAPILAQVPEARVLITGEVLEQWVVANPAAASGFLTEELRAGRTPPGSQRLVAQWALNDSAAAAAWVEKLPAGEFRKLAEENLVNTWARTNPSAAQTWKKRMTKP